MAQGKTSEQLTFEVYKVSQGAVGLAIYFLFFCAYKKKLQ